MRHYKAPPATLPRPRATAPHHASCPVRRSMNAPRSTSPLRAHQPQRTTSPSSLDSLLHLQLRNRPKVNCRKEADVMDIPDHDCEEVDEEEEEGEELIEGSPVPAVYTRGDFTPFPHRISMFDERMDERIDNHIVQSTPSMKMEPGRGLEKAFHDLIWAAPKKISISWAKDFRYVLITDTKLPEGRRVVRLDVDPQGMITVAVIMTVEKIGERLASRIEKRKNKTQAGTQGRGWWGRAGQLRGCIGGHLDQVAGRLGWEIRKTKVLVGMDENIIDLDEERE